MCTITGGREGIAIMPVVQLVEEVLRHASFGCLLESGRIAGTGTADELHDSNLLRQMYLGGTPMWRRKTTTMLPATPAARARTVP